MTLATGSPCYTLSIFSLFLLERFLAFPPNTSCDTKFMNHTLGLAGSFDITPSCTESAVTNLASVVFSKCTPAHPYSLSGLFSVVWVSIKCSSRMRMLCYILRNIQAYIKKVDFIVHLSIRAFQANFLLTFLVEMYL